MDKTELTLKQFAFEIEDNIPIKTEKAPISPKTDPLNDAIYNYANKLLPIQSFLLQISLFGTLKTPYSKVKGQLDKLTKFYKNGGTIVEYTCRVQKDENKNIIGYRVWRIQ